MGCYGVGSNITTRTMGYASLIHTVRGGLLWGERAIEQNGVVGVGGSNPLAPTNKDKG